MHTTENWGDEGTFHAFSFGPVKVYYNGSIYLWTFEVGRFCVTWEKR